MRLSSDIRQDLFDYFDNEHGIMLLDSDFNEIENIIEPMAMSCKPHIIGRIGDDDDITSMLIPALTNVCQVFDGWHQDGTVWSEFDENCRQEISKILKICERRSVR